MIDDITTRLVDFLQDLARADGLAVTVTPTTGLLESGILNSMRTVALIAFIRTDLGVEVGAADLQIAAFESVDALARTVAEVAAESDAGTGTEGAVCPYSGVAS